MDIVFMGTPEFAVPPLLALIDKHNVTAVVTQPDRPKGRGGKMLFPPVKETALKFGIPVLQPERLRKKASVEELKKYNADVYVVAAYGQLLSKTVLGIPRFGALNIHGSLLPKYRGASPIHQAVINGDGITGITIMRMDAGLDTGDMLLKREIEICRSDTTGTLHDKMSDLGASAILDALAQIEAGTAVYEKQNDADSTYAPLIQKEQGHIDWTMTVTDIANLVRGLNPWPSAYTYTENGDMLKIWATEVLTESDGCGEAGKITAIDHSKGIVVAATGGTLLITEVQGAGGKRMKTPDYLRGRHLEVGMVFK